MTPSIKSPNKPHSCHQLYIRWFLGEYSLNAGATLLEFVQRLFRAWRCWYLSNAALLGRWFHSSCWLEARINWFYVWSLEFSNNCPPVHELDKGLCRPDWQTHKRTSSWPQQNNTIARWVVFWLHNVQLQFVGFPLVWPGLLSFKAHLDFFYQARKTYTSTNCEGASALDHSKQKNLRYIRPGTSTRENVIDFEVEVAGGWFGKANGYVVLRHYLSRFITNKSRMKLKKRITHAHITLQNLQEMCL